MARRRIGVADQEILVGWDVGESVSALARRLGYTRVTVRKYVQAAEQVGLRRGAGLRAEAEWIRLAQAAIAQVAKPRERGPASGEVARDHDYLDARVGTVVLLVLHQRLRDEQGLGQLAHVPPLCARAVAGAPQLAAAHDDSLGRSTARRGGTGRFLLRRSLVRPNRGTSVQLMRCS